MFVYGPVPSRRLGRSLGVSPIPPKTCTYSCVYCQLGRTTHLQVQRRSFFRKEAVLAEIAAALNSADTDFITFAGDGEPTLSADLGWLIRQCRKRFPKPVAVITNGSLLFRADVRYDLAAADIVLPSIDAGDDILFRCVNRPHGQLDFQTVRRGLTRFRRDFAGELWLEVMLVAGLNDTDEALYSIRDMVEPVQPHQIYIMTPTRPPAEAWVKSASPERLFRARMLLGHAEALFQHETGPFGWKALPNAKAALLSIGFRHPLRMKQARQIERAFSEPGTVAEMLKNHQLIRVAYRGDDYLLPASFVRK